MASFQPVPGLPAVLRRVSALSGIHQPVNSYLWCESLIDPAADVTRAEVANAHTEVSQVLVTHVQEEHIAGAVAFPEAPLYVPAGDEYLCEGEVAYRNGIQRWAAPWDWTERGNFQGHVAGARNERPPQESLPVEGVLHDGDLIIGLRVLATPGQGKHAVTLLLDIAGRRVAFCGDLICGDGQLWNWFDAEWDYGLQLGQKTLLASARRLLDEQPDILLPSHGEPIYEATRALEQLIERLERVLEDPIFGNPVNFSDNDGPSPGWRTLSPHLYQWKTGNCVLLTSRDGVGLLVDDGLCDWAPLAERGPHHHAVMEEIKAALGLSRIEAVLITHFHGDHIYNIPMLLEDEEAQVITLDTVAHIINHPEEYNCASPLWWYGAEHEDVPIHRTLREGEHLRWREYDLEFFHLGGQTFYHCGIAGQIDGAQVVFVGDALYGWDTGCEPVMCYNDAEPASRGWAYSIERMIEQQPDLLVCGHGSAIRNPASLLQLKRDAWRQRLAKFDVLNARPSRRLFFDPFAGAF